MKYGRTSADNCKANRTTMTLEWHPSQGFPSIPSPTMIVDIGICVIFCMGLFVEEYKAWTMCSNNPTNTMDFATFHASWETAVNIASFTATPALQNGCSMNALEDNASTASLTDAVSNFGTAYVAMQESIGNNNAFINAMQGQIQMLCNAIGNQPPASMLHYPQQNNRDHQANGGVMVNNKTKANRDNQAAVVMAPTTAAVETDSTGAMMAVADTIRAAA
jgi:hypothetical protein